MQHIVWQTCLTCETSLPVDILSRDVPDAQDPILALVLVLGAIVVSLACVVWVAGEVGTIWLACSKWTQEGMCSWLLLEQEPPGSSFDGSSKKVQMLKHAETDTSPCPTSSSDIFWTVGLFWFFCWCWWSWSWWAGCGRCNSWCRRETLNFKQEPSGTLGSTWLHCPEELLCCSNLRNPSYPSCKSSAYCLLFTVYSSWRRRLWCLMIRSSSFWIRSDTSEQVPSRIDMQQSHIKSGKHTLAP